jgi:hypothetical protein
VYQIIIHSRMQQQKHSAEQKKSNIKQYMQFDFTYITFQNRQNYSLVSESILVVSWIGRIDMKGYIGNRNVIQLDLVVFVRVIYLYITLYTKYIPIKWISKTKTEGFCITVTCHYFSLIVTLHKLLI